MTMKLLGPFTQIVTLRKLPLRGPLRDDACEIIHNGGILFDNGRIIKVDAFSALHSIGAQHHPVPSPSVAFPALIDAHTHMCFAGSRANEYAMRLEGATYQQIQQNGGGILSTVNATRSSSEAELLRLLLERLKKAKNSGVATCEIKSGYGLDFATEIKILETLRQAKALQPVQIVSTCLAAHVVPPEFHDQESYLEFIENTLWPELKARGLAQRIDIFIESNAFSKENAVRHLAKAVQQGFSACAHADQFSSGNALAAAHAGARSVDHLEQTTVEDARALAVTNTAAVVLPGATLGLGEPFPPARMLLDEGNCVAIASDWNPGTAPMGNLLVLAAVMGAQQKLTMAETWAGVTYRAAASLGLDDRGRLGAGLRMDLAVYPCEDWREVLYYQGSLEPVEVWIGGEHVSG